MRFLPAILMLIGAPAEDAAPGREFFETKVRPVLVEHCYRCHSSESRDLQGKLRLDRRSGWQLGGESGLPAIVPGRPDESPLIRAVRHDAGVSAMPPDRPRLPATVIADLANWVRGGAVDPRDGDVPLREDSAHREAEFRLRLGWWSLQPVTPGALPPVRHAAWPRVDVDRFVLAKLESQGLQPSPPADRGTLARRLSFVLTGLPPDAEVVERFVADDSPQAEDELVARLLDSPQFGEYWARHWMDVVRYTDTYGYESDNPANGAYEYRDYLIRAFNQDVPFDQLVREQIAGDLLPMPRVDREIGIHESVIGPMFYHLGEHREGGSLMFNGIHQQMVDNKIDAFSKAFLATTIACARCHDHKYEAIPQRDYYALAAVFMTPRWTSRVIDAPGRNDAALAKLKELRSEIRNELAAIWLAKLSQEHVWPVEMLQRAVAGSDRAKWTIDDVAYPIARLLAAEGDAVSAWKALGSEWREARQRRRTEMAAYRVLADFQHPCMPAGWVVEGDGMQHGHVDEGMPLVALSGDDVVARILPRGFHTHALSSKLPGALRSPAQHEIPGKFVSLQLGGGEYGGYLYVQGNGFKSEKIGFFTSPVPSWRSFADELLVNGVPGVTLEFATTALNPNFPPRIGLSQGLPPTDPGYDKRSWVSITGIVAHDQEGVPPAPLDHFAPLYEGETPQSAAAVSARLSAWLAGAARQWCAHQCRPGDSLVVQWLLESGLLPNRAAESSRLTDLVQAYRRVEQSIPFPRTVTGMDERGQGELRYPINVRGDVDVVGERVPPDFLQMFAGRNDVAASAGSGRRELAEFLVRPDHPLTSRVYVNRVWQWIFGTGLVSTPDDFGHLGEVPSHPELLDYLAREFVDEGWSTKRLVRRLVRSATFRQSGLGTDAARRVDPANRLLHHYPTRRLEAEAIRDSLLAVSGRLDLTLYGRPIAPPRTAEDNKNKRLLSGPLDGHGRRSLYLFLSIMEPPRFLVTFNLPDLKLPAGKRDVTNVPSQALAMLNDPLVVALARFWAEQLVAEKHEGPDERIAAMFRRSLGRSPTADERHRWRAALHDFATEGDVDIMTDVSAWGRVAHALFNTKEFLYYR